MRVGGGRRKLTKVDGNRQKSTPALKRLAKKDKEVNKWQIFREN